MLIAISICISCAPEKPKPEGETYESIHGAPSKPNPVAENTDLTKGIGQVKTVTLETPLDQVRISRGSSIYEMKCQPCHRLDDQRLVGPGFKGVTERRKPEWIMNMITNVDVMLDQDPTAQELLELCLTRMPNQNVSIGDARDVLEFMRKNDGGQ